MRRFAFALALAAVLPATAAAEATLNKCIDAHGRVTYSNLPCPKSRTAQKIEIDPAPPVPAAAAATGKPASSKRVPARPPAHLQLEAERTPEQPAPRVSTRQCDALTDKLGRLLDKMDQARRQGYTLEQMNRWNAEVRELERKKQQSGCF